MLSKDECKKATTKWKDTIKKWQKEKATVKEINKIIDPTAVFNFSQADCKWIHDNNKVSNFNAYAGIYDHKFILRVFVNLTYYGHILAALALFYVKATS